MTRYLTVRHERLLHHPRDRAYAWLTDYEAADAQRAGAVLTSREVVSQEGDRIALDEEIRSLGLERSVRTVVELDPPDRWTAQVHHTPGAEPDLFEYQLEAVDDGSSRLTVAYRYAATNLLERFMLWLLRPWLRKETTRMWEGFEAAMDAELGPQTRATTP